MSGFDFDFKPIPLHTMESGKILEARIAKSGLYMFAFTGGGDLPPELKGSFSSVEIMHNFLQRYLSRLDAPRRAKEKRAKEKKAKKIIEAGVKRGASRTRNRKAMQRELIKRKVITKADLLGVPSKESAA